MTFDIRHGEQVTLISIPDRYQDNDCPIKLGQRGKVIALQSPDGYLIKWERRSGPVAVRRQNIERAE